MIDPKILDPLLLKIDARLRLAKPEDGPGIQAMLSGLAALEWPDLPHDVATNVARSLPLWPASGIILAVDANKVVAAAALHLVPDLIGGIPQLLIDDFFVHPKQRGKGVGGALIHGVIAIGQSLGARRLFIQLDPGNGRAQQLLAKLGFTADGDRVWTRG